jgi:hypothetical protein
MVSGGLSFLTITSPHHPVLTNFVGPYLKCLRTDDVVAVYSNASCCLCCHGEGHQALICKRPRSPDSVGWPLCQHCVAAGAIFDRRSSHVALAKLRHQDSRSLSRSMGQRTPCPPLPSAIGGVHRSSLASGVPSSACTLCRKPGRRQ